MFFENRNFSLFLASEACEQMSSDIGCKASRFHRNNFLNFDMHSKGTQTRDCVKIHNFTLLNEAK